MHCNTVWVVVQVWLVVGLLCGVIGGVSGSAAADWWVGEAVGIGGLRVCGWGVARRGLGGGWRVALAEWACACPHCAWKKPGDLSHTACGKHT